MYIYIYIYGEREREMLYMCVYIYIYILYIYIYTCIYIYISLSLSLSLSLSIYIYIYIYMYARRLGADAGLLEVQSHKYCDKKGCDDALRGSSISSSSCFLLFVCFLRSSSSSFDVSDLTRAYSRRLPQQTRLVYAWQVNVSTGAY